MLRPNSHSRWASTTKTTVLPSGSICNQIPNAHPEEEDNLHGMKRDVRLHDEDVLHSSAALSQASKWSIESILEWPILKEYISHADDVFESTLVEVLASSSRNVASYIPGESELDVSENTVKILCKRFVAYNHFRNPVLEPEALLSDAEVFICDGLLWNGRSCLLVCLPLFSLL
jgi:hypothetical protein